MAHIIPLTETFVNVNDMSIIYDQDEALSTIPFYLMAFSSDKGPEEMLEVSGDKFFKLFGDKNKDISFKRHGQPLIQAAAAIDAGARVICKRIVAPDAKLANVTVFAEVMLQERKIIKTKKDANGRIRQVFEDTTKPSSDDNEYLWDAEGKYQPKLIDDTQGRNSVLIRYFTESYDDVKDIKDLNARVAGKRDGGVYPLFTITDNGRGLSNKSFRIVPSYFTRAGAANAMKHTIQVLEKNTVIEERDFVFHPEVVLNNVNLGMNASINTGMLQIKCKQYEESVLDLYQFIIKNTIEEDVHEEDYLAYLKSIDILFGRDRRNILEEITVVSSEDDPKNDLFQTHHNPATIINMSTPHGITLTNGDNGSFGDAPINKVVYEEELYKFFNGDITTEIYDNHKWVIDIVADANYPLKVKTAIEEFVCEYRDDTIYLRDFGLGMNSLQEIMEMRYSFVSHRNCADYYLSYDIIDPYSHKQITVTSTFELTELFVEHCRNGRHRPNAGIPNNFILKRAIKGTESFIPVKHKYSDQRQTLDTAHVNYCIYHDNQLVVETNWTSQEEYSQMSFINNVMNIQRLIKKIRIKCPKIRYAFMHGKDLDNYKSDIDRELESEQGNFALLRTIYIVNNRSHVDKQIHMVIEVACKDWIRSERFDINIINLQY